MYTKRTNFQFFIIYFLDTSHDTWDFSMLTRDQTNAICIGRQSLNHWTTREISQTTNFCMLILESTTSLICVVRSSIFDSLRILRRQPSLTNDGGSDFPSLWVYVSFFLRCIALATASRTTLGLSSIIVLPLSPPTILHYVGCFYRSEMLFTNFSKYASEYCLDGN